MVPRGAFQVKKREVLTRGSPGILKKRKEKNNSNDKWEDKKMPIPVVGSLLYIDY